MRGDTRDAHLVRLDSRPGLDMSSANELLDERVSAMLTVYAERADQGIALCVIRPSDSDFFSSIGLASIALCFYFTKLFCA